MSKKVPLYYYFHACPAPHTQTSLPFLTYTVQFSYLADCHKLSPGPQRPSLYCSINTFKTDITFLAFIPAINHTDTQ